MGHKGETSAVGCKVLPICDAVSVGSNGGDCIESGEKVDLTAQKSKRRRTVSRMKELLRWAAAAKSHKVSSKPWKVLYFQNRGGNKDSMDDMSSSSSKIGFKWDVGSCSSTSSVYSPLSLTSMNHRTNQILEKNSASNLSVNLQSSESENETAAKLSNTKIHESVRMGQWITTDSDFVVLEL